jgi:hypothetical protein
MGISAAAIVGIAAAGSATVGAASSIYGANKAASSAKDAANAQKQQFEQTRADLSPYFTPGQEAFGNALQLAKDNPFGSGPDYIGQAADYFDQAGNWARRAGDYVNVAGENVPGQMTQQQLEATPGYQFTLDQGLKATQSAMAARGLGVSGAALKGAAAYATGLADKTYQDQFNIQQQRFGDFLTLATGASNAGTGLTNAGANNLNLNTARQGNLTNEFNRYNSLATIGENAAAQSGAQGTQAAANQGNYLNQAGLATAAGVQGVNSAITGAANNYLAYDAYNRRTAAQPNNQPMGVYPGASGQNYGPPTTATG